MTFYVAVPGPQRVWYWQQIINLLCTFSSAITDISRPALLKCLLFKHFRKHTMLSMPQSDVIIMLLNHNYVIIICIMRLGVTHCAISLCAHNLTLLTVNVTLTLIIIFRSVAIVQMPWQLNCRDICEIGTWLDNWNKSERNGSFVRFELWAQKPFLEYVPDSLVTSQRKSSLKPGMPGDV